MAAYLFSVIVIVLIVAISYLKIIAMIVGGSWALFLTVSYILTILQLVFGPWPVKLFGFLILFLLLMGTASYFEWVDVDTQIFDMEFWGICEFGYCD